MKATTLLILISALKNVFVMLCWTALALHFGKWWIALFACLCFSSVKVENTERRKRNGQ